MKELLGPPTFEGYLWFCGIMKEMNFQKIGSKQIKKDFIRLDLERRFRKKLTGREVGFVYASPYSLYLVKVWTSFLEKEERLRDLGEDVGWVIICKGDVLVYCARYFLRSNQQFFLALARYAWISKYKVDHVPLCPCESCGRRMYIFRKRGTRQYMWRCDNPKVHRRATFRIWDYGLGDKAQEFLNIRRKHTANYKKQNEKKGLNPTPKAQTRRVRKVGKPENLE